MEDNKQLVHMYDPTDDFDVSVEDAEAYEINEDEEVLSESKKKYNSTVIAVAGAISIAVFCAIVFKICAALLG